MGIALSLEGAAFSIYTAGGHHQRCITVKERFARGHKAEDPVSPMESIGSMVEIALQSLRAVKLFRVRHVGVKGYAHDAKWRIHQLGEVAGIIKAYMWSTPKMVVEVVAPSVALRHVLTPGQKMTQESLRDFVENGLGVQVSNHMEVDATIVARYLFDRVVAREKEIKV